MHARRQENKPYITHIMSRAFLIIHGYYLRFYYATSKRFILGCLRVDCLILILYSVVGFDTSFLLALAAFNILAQGSDTNRHAVTTLHTRFLSHVEIAV